MSAEGVLLVTSVAIMSINGIWELLSKIYNSLTDKVDELIYYRVIIDSDDNPRLKRAITEEIKSKNLHSSNSTITMVDAGRTTEIDVQIGKYEYDHEVTEKVLFEIKDKQIIVKIPKFTFNKLNEQTMIREVIDNMYNNHNDFSKVMMFFMSDGGKWVRPIVRKPRNFVSMKLTRSMENVTYDFQWFMSSQAKEFYQSKARPYRRGYFLHGKAGTNKSTMAELLSYKFEMPVYMITFNCEDMNDNVLVNLCSTVPPRSIIMIDEIDKQLDTIKQNNKITLSTAGLLMAIDGPQRLSEGTLVILTANRKEILPLAEQRSLLRPGRIDKTFEFM